MKFSTLIVLIPVAVIAALFAVANRQEVFVKLDPFAKGDNGLTLAMPLYELAFVAFILGVLLGGVVLSLNRGLNARRRFKAREIGNALATLSAEPPNEGTLQAPNGGRA